VRPIAIAIAFALAVLTSTAYAEIRRTLAGSLQLDYLAVPTDSHSRLTTLDGTTVELSLKMSVDFTPTTSATVKMCFACHGFEAAAAFVDLHVSDELVIRAGRMTPEFGSFPQRHDPANHVTNDKPLPYDMGRMVRHTDWNEGVLPAPWVDNGLELFGTHFVSGGQIDYAIYAISGPRIGVGVADATDLDFIASRQPHQYYVDNNSEPSVGARLAGTTDLDDEGHSLSFGASVMTGRYDTDHHLAFTIAGVDFVANLAPFTLRAEYLVRSTDMARGADLTRWKNGQFEDHFLKHGFYGELDVPIGRTDAFARFDGLMRDGNTLTTSVLGPTSRLYRYTIGAAFRVVSSVKVKTSVEYYQFSDLDNEVAIHLGIATPF
jgi:hypothetical protein